VSEIEAKKQGQKKTIFTLITFSVALVPVSFCLYFAAYLIWPPMWPKHTIDILVVAACVTMLVAFALGLVAFVKAAKAKIISIVLLMGLIVAAEACGAAFSLSELKRSWELYYVEPQVRCRHNLCSLMDGLRPYKEYGKYPTPQGWCDWLVRGRKISQKYFRCPEGKRVKSSYAMNPNCEPNSLPDVVLLFETKGGWNQFGGAELLTTENHQGDGCNILFNDFSVRFVKSEEIGQLNWGDKQGNR